jgi:hypothetical protein
MLSLQTRVELSINSNMNISQWVIILSGSLMLVVLIICYKLFWLPYIA